MNTNFDPQTINDLIALENEARNAYQDYPSEFNATVLAESTSAVIAAIKGLGAFADAKLDAVEQGLAQALNN